MNRQKRVSMSRADRETLQSKAIELFRAQKTVSQVAEMVGVSSKTIYRWRYLAYQQGELTTSSVKGYSDEFIGSILQQVDQGQPIGQIARARGVSILQIHRWRYRIAQEKAPGSLPKYGIADWRRYPVLVKEQVFQHLAQGMPIEQVSKTMGVSQRILQTWINQTDKAGGAESVLITQQDIDCLRQQLPKVEQEQNRLPNVLAILRQSS